MGTFEPVGPSPSNGTNGSLPEQVSGRPGLLGATESLVDIVS